MKYKIKKFFIFFILIDIIFLNISFATDNIATGALLDNNNLPDKLGIVADSCYLLDINSNKTLYEKNGNKRMSPASTTKTLTAILTLEKCNDLSQMVNVSYYAVKSVPFSYSIASLVTGEKISIKDLLTSLLVASANDSAFVLAQYIANGCKNEYSIDSSNESHIKFQNDISTFSDMMNNRAIDLGCTDSHFVNPNGIQNDSHYSTAHDLALIGKFAKSFNLLNQIVKSTECTISNTNMYNYDIRHFTTTNSLLLKNKKGYYKYADGLKTGYTNVAGYCIIASATKDNRQLIAVILGSPKCGGSDDSREADCKRLFEYGFNNFEYRTLITKGEKFSTFKVKNATDSTKEINLVSNNEINYLIEKGTIQELSPQITIKKLVAPIAKDSVVGIVKYNIDGIDYQADLIADKDVYEQDYRWIFVIFLFVLSSLLIIVISVEKHKSKKRKKRRYLQKN